MNCGRVYQDDAEELLKGCECSGKLFLYEDRIKFKKKELKKNLKHKRDDLIEGISEFLYHLKRDVQTKFKSKVSFDLESKKVIENGVYEIDLKKLLNEVPLIVEIKEGKYFVHLASLFKKGKDKTISLDDLELE